MKWDPQQAQEIAVLPSSTPPLPCSEPVQSVRGRSGGQWRWPVQFQTRHLSQAVYQKYQGTVTSVFTLLPCLRNHYVAGRAYLCCSTPSALPHAHWAPGHWSKFLFLTYAEWNLFKGNEILFRWPASPIIQGSISCFVFFFVKMYFKPNHHALWWNLWSISINLQEKELKDALYHHYYFTFSKSTSLCNSQEK